MITGSLGRKRGKVMKKVKQKEARLFMWIITVWCFIIFFLVTAMLGTYMFVIDVIMIAVLLCSWYKTITGIGYIEVGEGKLHVVTECWEEGYRNWPTKRTIKIDEEFRVEDIVRMGYTMDLYGHWIYIHRNEYKVMTREYEIVFELNNGKRIFIDLAYFYTKKQQRKIFQYIYEINGLKPEGKLRRDLKIE